MAILISTIQDKEGLSKLKVSPMVGALWPELTSTRVLLKEGSKVTNYKSISTVLEEHRATMKVTKNRNEHRALDSRTYNYYHMSWWISQVEEPAMGILQAEVQ